VKVLLNIEIHSQNMMKILMNDIFQFSMTDKHKIIYLLHSVNELKNS